MVRQSRESGHDGALSRALPQLRAHARGTAVRQADHRHRPDRLRSFTLQPASPRAREAGARRHHRGRRPLHGVPCPPDPGDRQAPDRGARPQPRLSRPGRDPLRLSARRRGADHRLRQDHAGLHHGGGHGEPARDRPLRRADAERLVARRADRLRHGGVEGARAACRGRDRLQRIHRDRRLVGAVGRPLQHHGHGLDDELDRRGARHEPARLRGHPRSLSRARPDRLRDRKTRRRDGVGGPQAVRHPHPRGLRKRHRRQLGDRRLDQRADPRQCHRPPCRGQARHRGLGEGRPQGSAARQPAARRKISRRGVSPRRRRAGRGQRADEEGPDPRRRAHRQRQDHGRQLPRSRVARSAT